MGLPIATVLDSNPTRIKFLRERLQDRYSVLSFADWEEFQSSPEQSEPVLAFFEAEQATRVHDFSPQIGRILPHATRVLVFDKKSLASLDRIDSHQFDRAVLWSDAVHWIERQIFECEKTFESSVHQLKLERTANTDFLTGLRNRRYFEDRLSAELKLCLRHERQLALILMDVDFFKKVNDVRGHQQGDEVLERLASLIRNDLRNEDLTARLGGDEFAIILPESTIQGAMHVAERLRQLINNDRECQQHGVTMSFGVAAFPAHARTGDELFRKTDAALLAAKQQGKNKVQSCQETT